MSGPAFSFPHANCYLLIAYLLIALLAPPTGQLRPEIQLLTSQRGSSLPSTGRETMLWTIFAILIILWLLGWGFHVAGGLIHLLLVIAVIVAVINFMHPRRTT
jgi:hypothetical protein